MLDRRVRSYADAVAGMRDGCSVMLGGFGGSGQALGLIQAVLDAGVRGLTVISNNGGSLDPDLSILLRAERVRRLVCSYPKSTSTKLFEELWQAGKVELELVPQGTLVERMRAAGAGLGGFFTPVGAGTEIARGKETRVIDGRPHVFEQPLRADVALLKAHQADRLGNLTYRLAARNFSPVMATAATLVVVEADAEAEVGAIPPEAVVTPGIFVDRVVFKGSPA